MAEKTLAQTLAALRKKDSDLRVGSLADFDMNVKAFSTGNLSLDSATGIGGLPRGRVIELFGVSQSGKTTAALGTAATHQKRVLAGLDEGAILYLDYEYSLDENYCATLGLDVNDASTFIYVQPDNLEQGAQIFRDLTKAGHLAFGIVDSVAAMATKKEIEAVSGSVSVGERAKLITQLLRTSKGMLHRTQSSLILVNHILDYIETGPSYSRVKKTYTPGGSGIAFYSDMRIQFMIGTSVGAKQLNSVTQEEENIQTAANIRAKVTKNKVALPQRLAHMQVRFGKGFSQPYSAYHAVKAHRGIKVTQTGGRHTIPADLSPTGEETLIVKTENVIRLLETDSETLDKWVAKAKELIDNWTDDKVTDDVDFNPDIDPDTGEVRDD